MYKVTEIKTGKIYAVKRFMKENLANEKHVENLKREIELNRILEHENLVKLHSVYESNNYVNLVFENLEGGPIADSKFPGKIKKIKNIKKVIYSVLQGLKYLNDQGIVHMDIKPNNILFVDNSQNSLKIIDLGLAHEYLSMDYIIAGTPGFIDPDLFLKKSSKFESSKIDVFSLGIILYFYLFGKYPYQGKNKIEILERNKNGYFLPEKFDDMITDVKCEKAYDLLMRMTEVKLNRRISIQEALSHPFFEKMGEDKSRNDNLFKVEQEWVSGDISPSSIFEKYAGRKKKFMQGLMNRM